MGIGAWRVRVFHEQGGNATVMGTWCVGNFMTSGSPQFWMR